MPWYDRFLTLFRRDAVTSLPTDFDPSRAATVNHLSGLGMPADFGAATRPNTTRMYLDERELLALAAQDMYWRLCVFYPALALYRGFTITDDSDDIAPLSEEIETLGVLPAFEHGGARGQAYGTAYLLLSVDDGGRLDRPLDPAKVRRVNALIPVAARELTPLAYCGDDRSAALGEVETWQFQARRQSIGVASTVIHASRLIKFYGLNPGPEAEQTNVGTIWHGHNEIAMGQVWNDALMQLATVHRSGAHLAAELSVSVFKIADAELKMGADSRTTFLDYMRLIAKMKSVINGVLLTPADSMERLGANIAGFWDLYRTAVGNIAGVTGIPQSAIFGEAPGGLTTDNEAGWRMAEMQATRFFRDRMKPGLRTIIACLYGAKRAASKWQIAMNPIGTLSPKEQAEVRKLHTEADSTAIADGVLSPDQVARSRYSDRGWQDQIQPATPEEEQPDPAAMQEAMQEQHDADFTGKALLCVRLSEQGRAAWSELVKTAEAIVGRLEGYEAGEDGIVETPHLTLLYLGAVPAESVPDIEARARKIVEDVPPFALPVRRVYVLPAGPVSAGRLPVVAEIDAWEARELNGGLLRALAHHVTAEQFPTFRGHVTLGFASAIDGEQLAKLAEITGPIAGPRLSLGSVGAVELVYNNEVFATVPLLGRRTDAE